MASVKQKSALDGENTSAVQTSSGIYKSGSSTDAKSGRTLDKSDGLKVDPRKTSETLPKVNGRKKQAQTVRSKTGNQKNLAVSEVVGHPPVSTVEGTVNDSMIVGENIPETTTGIRFKNTQGRKKKTICIL